MSVALAKGDGPDPPAAPGQGGLVYLDSCFTQPLGIVQKYSIVNGYRVTGLIPGAGYDLKVYAVNSAGAGYPGARAVLPPVVLD